MRLYQKGIKSDTKRPGASEIGEAYKLSCGLCLLLYCLFRGRPLRHSTSFRPSWSASLFVSLLQSFILCICYPLRYYRLSVIAIRTKGCFYHLSITVLISMIKIQRHQEQARGRKADSMLTCGVW